MLLHPSCAVAYAAEALKSIVDRIRTEKVPLERFFGQHYQDNYCARVPTCIRHQGRIGTHVLQSCLSFVFVYCLFF